jgi:hypothetical protein
LRSNASCGDEQRLVCAECCVRSEAEAVGWRAYIALDAVNVQPSS